MPLCRSRSLLKEGYKQAKIDFLFNNLVLANFTYALTVYGASDSVLSPVQCFLGRCWERNFTTRNYNIRSISQKQDHSIFKRVCQAANHPLSLFIPRAGTAATIYGRGQSLTKHQK